MGRDQELQPEPGEGIAPGSTATLAFYADDGQGGIVMSGCIWTSDNRGRRVIHR
jgi:hypothetical protein